MNHIGDTNKMVSDTPCNATPREELRNQIMSSVIPKNEREWWANRTIEQLERELNVAQDRIKRLEEAGDAMLNAWLMPEDSMEYCDWIALSADVKAKWYKAKEDKL